MFALVMLAIKTKVARQNPAQIIAPVTAFASMALAFADTVGQAQIAPFMLALLIVRHTARAIFQPEFANVITSFLARLARSRLA